jgi:NAD(P)-dependent dehydrogenase (short-subunit alcohol dehydrogenase family)
MENVPGWLAVITSSLPGAVAPASAAGVRDPASPTILLTGSNRGVGPALVREYAAQGWNVIATCRTPIENQPLGALDQKLSHEVMDTNAYGALKLPEAPVANVQASRQKKIIGMTSGMGSLTLMGRMRRFCAASLYNLVAELTPQDKGLPVNVDGKVIHW